eukprot:394963-Alexandrium_andersonii.AAC.1
MIAVTRKVRCNCEGEGGRCPQPSHLTTLMPSRPVRHHAPEQLAQADRAHRPMLLSRGRLEEVARLD